MADSNDKRPDHSIAGESQQEDLQEEGDAPGEASAKRRALSLAGTVIAVAVGVGLGMLNIQLPEQGTDTAIPKNEIRDTYYDVHAAAEARNVTKYCGLFSARAQRAFSCRQIDPSKPFSDPGLRKRVAIDVDPSAGAARVTMLNGDVDSLVREGGRWRLDFPPSLIGSPAAPSSARELVPPR